ncbi:MAG: spondin domain-containing protein [Candidatus Cloacimonetes bacterium]|nr:spondin domain-containing protein [Candidatus Cloacimonadota bacterium]
MKIQLLLIFFTLFSQANATVFDVTITNLTTGMHFSQMLVTAHIESDPLFTPGQLASNAIETMAESESFVDFGSVGNVDLDTFKPAFPTSDLLNPGEKTSKVTLNTDSTANANHTHLSIVGRLIPTNDGFVGLNSYKVPTSVGTYQVYMNAWDAGTENNDENVISTVQGNNNTGIPQHTELNFNNSGSGLTFTRDENANKIGVHIHRGNLGDLVTNGSSSDISDLDRRIHRFMNPVALVTITVK